MRKFSLLLFCLVTCSLLSYGWGFFGHKTIAQLAIYALPKDMQAFYRSHMPYLIKNVVAPDERRNHDSLEAPRHFIDIDVPTFGADAVHQMPESWAPAVAKYSEDTLLKYGIVPWYVVVMKNRLTHAFQQQNADSILFYSADLAHYVQDAHVPLHTTQNHDGQLTNQQGLHSLWESKLPEQNATTYQFGHQKAKYLSNPEHEIWEVVRASHQLVPDLLALEKKVSQEFTEQTKYVVTERNGRTRRNYSDAFASAYQKALGTTVQNRMQDAAAMTANFWYTCWVDGGKPDLEKLLSTPPTKAEKSQWKVEQKAWKKGQLQEKNLFVTKPR